MPFVFYILSVISAYIVSPLGLISVVSLHYSKEAAKQHLRLHQKIVFLVG